MGGSLLLIYSSLHAFSTFNTLQSKLILCFGKHPLQHVGSHSFFYLVLYITQYTLSCLLLYGVAIVIHYITRIEVRLIPSYFSYAFGYRLPPIPDTLYY